MKVGAEQLKILSSRHTGDTAAAFTNIMNFKRNSTLISLLSDKDSGKGLAQHVHKNGRIYPIFQVMMATSHRFKCSNPNLQNIPKDKAIRSIFQAPDGFYMAEFDAAGLQLRLVAAQSNDEVMINTFKNSDGDLHSVTARNLFAPDMSIEDFKKRKGESPYKEMRKSAKFCNFGLVFNTTAKTFG